MLKTYRIIPVVFILFFFGFTLISVAPVLAQSTQENESRISALEEILCSLHPEAGTAKFSVCDVKRQEKVRRDTLTERYQKFQNNGCDGLPHMPDGSGMQILCRDLIGDDADMFTPQKMLEHEKERSKSFDKDPFTYYPNGNAHLSPDRKFLCVGFSEIRENPDEPKGVAYAKCKQKFDETREECRRTPETCQQ